MSFMFLFSFSLTLIPIKSAQWSITSTLQRQCHFNEHRPDFNSNSLNLSLKRLIVYLDTSRAVASVSWDVIIYLLRCPLSAENNHCFHPQLSYHSYRSIQTLFQSQDECSLGQYSTDCIQTNSLHASFEIHLKLACVIRNSSIKIYKNILHGVAILLRSCKDI